MRIHKTIHNILLIVTIAFLFLACENQTYRTKAAIIATTYESETGKYLIVLEGRKAVIINETNFRITISSTSKPTLAFDVNKYNKISSSGDVDYEFIFSSYEQAKEYLQLKSGKNAQVSGPATPSNCFISTSME